MSVKINIPSYLQYFTDNAKVVEVESGSVYECLKKLTEKFEGIKLVLFDNKGEIQIQPLNHVAVFKNGVAIEPDEYLNEVDDGDELDLIYVILGG